MFRATMAFSGLTALATGVLVVALAGALAAFAAATIRMSHGHRPGSACTYPGLVGKRVVLSSDSRVASTKDDIVFHVRDGRIRSPPILVSPKRSKYEGRAVGEVVEVLHAKFGPQYVQVYSYEMRHMVPTTDAAVVVLVDQDDIAREVRVPPRWKEPEDVDERLPLSGLVGKVPVVVDAERPPPLGRDPERVQLHVRYGMLARPPVLG